MKETLTSKKWRLAKFARYVRKARDFISREKQVFLLGFSVTFLSAKIKIIQACIMLLLSELLLIEILLKVLLTLL